MAVVAHQHTMLQSICGKLYWLPRNLHVHYMDEWISLMLRLLFFVSPLGP